MASTVGSRLQALWSSRPRMAIRAKVLVVLIVVSSICSLVVSSTLIAFFNEDKATYIQDLNADIASNSAASLGLLLEMYTDRLTEVGQAFNSSAEPAAAITPLFENTEAFVYLGIYDEEGRNLLNLCREGAISDAGVAVAEFRARRGQLEESPPWLRLQRMAVRNSSPSPRFLLFSLHKPFFASSYGKTFFLRADFRSDTVLKAIQRAPGYRTYVVDRKGMVFAHPDPAVMASEQSYASRKVVQAVVQHMGLTSAGTGEYQEPGEEPMLASYATLRDPGLGVVVERPTRDAYLAASRLSRKSMHAALLIIVISAVGSLLISRYATRPLLELSRAAARLEKGDFDVHVEPRTHDELGDVSRSFNLAAQGLKERDNKLRDTYEQLYQSEKLVAFGKFSAGIAHEIKNPLTGIIGFAQLLSRKLPEGDPKLHPLQLIEKEAKRCKTILDNLLKFTRKEGFQFEPVRLHAHVKETLELLAPQLGVSQVKASLDLQAPEDLIRGDGNQLRQVFMNLVLNSIDAMEGREDKRVGIATRAAEPGYIEVLISDSGSGIPEDKIRKIFDPFFTTKEPGKGTGLGLSVSYGILNHHGGKISVKSKLGEGTEFRIVLPLASAEVRQEERQRQERAARAETTPVPEGGASLTAAGAPVAGEPVGLSATGGTSG